MSRAVQVAFLAAALVAVGLFAARAGCFASPPTMPAVGDTVFYRAPDDLWASEWEVEAIVGPGTLRIESVEQGDEALVLVREVRRK